MAKPPSLPPVFRPARRSLRLQPPPLTPTASNAATRSATSAACRRCRSAADPPPRSRWASSAAATVRVNRRDSSNRPNVRTLTPRVSAAPGLPCCSIMSPRSASSRISSRLSRLRLLAGYCSPSSVALLPSAAHCPISFLPLSMPCLLCRWRTVRFPTYGCPQGLEAALEPKCLPTPSDRGGFPRFQVQPDRLGQLSTNTKSLYTGMTPHPPVQIPCPKWGVSRVTPYKAFRTAPAVARLGCRTSGLEPDHRRQPCSGVLHPGPAEPGG